MPNIVRRRRKAIRLKGWDYRAPAGYFVTICTHDRVPLFGRVVDGEMVLNAFGEIVRACWQEIPEHFPHVELDAFVVMPNHVHAIISIVDSVGATHASPLQRDTPRGPAPGSLGAIVGSFKSAVSRRINMLRNTPGAPVWQRNYYEHIIRTDRALNAIRRYIADTPLRWHLDRYNPHATGPDPQAHALWRMLQAEGEAVPRPYHPHSKSEKEVSHDCHPK